MAALITSRKRPSVSSVIGKVKNTSSGRTTAFTKPSSSAAIQSVIAPSMRMPGTSARATHSASADTAQRIRKPAMPRF